MVLNDVESLTAHLELAWLLLFEGIGGRSVCFEEALG